MRRRNPAAGDEVADTREATDFPGIEMILWIETEVTTAGSPARPETRYRNTSLGRAAVSPRRLMDLFDHESGMSIAYSFSGTASRESTTLAKPLLPAPLASVQLAVETGTHSKTSR